MIILEKAKLVKEYIKDNFEFENYDFSKTTDSLRHSFTENRNVDDIRFTNSKKTEVLEEYEVFSIGRNKRSVKKDVDSDLKQKIVVKLDQTWQQSLFETIDNKSIDEVELYKKSGITKQTFSKIRSDDKYHPDKDTAIRLCIGLELSLEETLDLLGKAGFTLSKSIERDLVFRYFIENKEYDLYVIDCVLEELKMKLLLKY